ncbi:MULTISPECIES: hypothetical protein [unclassified Microcoleus]|uniref:hypothetical protein n=1 Tax=unclassified Microcoleus TaxID=2642155 RepID=UPI002FD5B49D
MGLPFLEFLLRSLKNFSLRVLVDRPSFPKHQICEEKQRYISDGCRSIGRFGAVELNYIGGG